MEITPPMAASARKTITPRPIEYCIV